MSYFLHLPLTSQSYFLYITEQARGEMEMKTLGQNDNSAFHAGFCLSTLPTHSAGWLLAERGFMRRC